MAPKALHAGWYNHPPPAPSLSMARAL